MSEMKRNIFCLLLFFSCGSGNSNSRCVMEQLDINQEPIVSTLNGDLIGSRTTKIDRRQNKSVTWTSYNDIPYAEPPIGPLRFHPPVPASAWNCVLDARESQDKVCPQWSWIGHM